MPDITGTKISALDADSNLNDSDYLVGVDANASPIKTKKFTLSALKSFFQDGLVPTTRKVNNKALSADIVLDAVGSITLSLSWSGSGPYTQTVTMSGATISSNSKVDLQPTPAQIAQLIADGVEAIVIENNAGTLTATAIGATPSTALTMQCTVTEVVA